MAISLRNAGSWVAVNATTQVVTLPAHVAGDLLIVRAVCKPFSAAITMATSGWNPVAAQRTNGSTANGVGVGSMAFRAFYKVAESSSEPNPTVTWGTTANPGIAVGMAYQLGAGETWVVPVGDGGGDATARTAQTSTIATHVSVQAGDLVDFFRGSADDAGVLTVPTITQTGVTFAAVVESPATAIASGTGNDIAGDGGYRIASSGTSSAAAVCTGTSSASEEHGAWMTRLRVDTLTPKAGSDAGVGSRGLPGRGRRRPPVVRGGDRVGDRSGPSVSRGSRTGVAVESAPVAIPVSSSESGAGADLASLAAGLAGSDGERGRMSRDPRGPSSRRQRRDPARTCRDPSDSPATRTRGSGSRRRPSPSRSRGAGRVVSGRISPAW